MQWELTVVFRLKDDIDGNFEQKLEDALKGEQWASGTWVNRDPNFGMRDICFLYEDEEQAMNDIEVAEKLLKEEDYEDVEVYVHEQKPEED